MIRISASIACLALRNKGYFVFVDQNGLQIFCNKILIGTIFPDNQFYDEKAINFFVNNQKYICSLYENKI